MTTAMTTTHTPTILSSREHDIATVTLSNPGKLNALNAAANKALTQAELRERFLKVGLEPTGGSAQDLADIMKRDTDRWGPVVKASGFKAD